MLHRSREFAGWNQLLCGPVLTPNISCTKLKIHSAHADSPIVPEKKMMNPIGKNFMEQPCSYQFRDPLLNFF